MAFRNLLLSVAATSLVLGGFALAACSSTPAEKPSGIPGIGTVDSGDNGSGDVDAACVGDNGCYACAPTKLVEFLNQCSGSQCAPFDNAARLPLYDGGALPPLP